MSTFPNISKPWVVAGILTVGFAGAWLFRLPAPRAVSAETPLVDAAQSSPEPIAVDSAFAPPVAPLKPVVVPQTASSPAPASPFALNLSAAPWNRPPVAPRASVSAESPKQTPQALPPSTLPPSTSPPTALPSPTVVETPAAAAPGAPLRWQDPSAYAKHGSAPVRTYPETDVSRREALTAARPVMPQHQHMANNAPPYAAQQHVASQQPAEARLHVVRDGDSLYRLAQQYLGDGRKEAELFQANRDLLADPQILPIGARLRIPSPSNTTAQPLDSHLQPLGRLAPIPQNAWQ